MVYLPSTFNKVAKQPLFTKKGISEKFHFGIYKIELIDGLSNRSYFTRYLDSFEELEEVFREEPLIKHLVELNYPNSSISALLKCNTSRTILRDGKEISVRFHCDNPICPCCSLRRFVRKKIKYSKFFKGLELNNKYNISLLTISPKNYPDTLEGIKNGYKELKETFNKFRKTKYISERILGGLYVFEFKNKNRYGECKGWNIHVHCLFYGRRLDNKIRGYCNNCKKKVRLKYDSDKKVHYCFYKACQSSDVVVEEKDSLLTRLWKSITNQEVHVDIRQINNFYSGLDYCLKYISTSKEDFKDDLSIAQYLSVIRGKRQIHTFGCFYKHKKK
ncbi:MAG: protein rep [Candidatus Pacearchaeota archaeon]